MPIQLRKLNQDEAAGAFPRRLQMDLSEYVDALAALQPGDAAAIHLGDLTARAAKRRLGQAANQLGYRLRWGRGTEKLAAYFQVLAKATPRTQRPAGASGSGKSRRAVSVTNPASAPPRRGRRRRVDV